MASTIGRHKIRLPREGFRVIKYNSKALTKATAKLKSMREEVEGANASKDDEERVYSSLAVVVCATKYKAGAAPACY